jgi:hypothetical protein
MLDLLLGFSIFIMICVIKGTKQSVVAVLKSAGFSGEVFRWEGVLKEKVPLAGKLSGTVHVLPILLLLPL